MLVCKEPALPYDRVKTSKALDVKLESITFRTAAFYKVGILGWYVMCSVMLLEGQEGISELMGNIFRILCNAGK